MTHIDQSVTDILNILSVYIGYLTVFVGIVGNVFNILVFTQLKLFHGKQAALYLTAISAVDCFRLLSSVATRVTGAAFGVDPTRLSLVWCKVRSYIAACSSMISMGIICLAAIDQYLSTSYRVLLRQRSTLRLAQRSTASLSLFSALYCIPLLIFNEIRPNFGCATYDVAFNYFYSFIHFCIIVGLLPLAIASVFSLLAYHNVRHIIRRQIALVRRLLDRQLTSMILMRVILLVLSTLPFVIVRIYQLNTPVDDADPLTIATDQIIRFVGRTLNTFGYAVGQHRLVDACVPFSSCSAGQLLPISSHLASIPTASAICHSTKTLSRMLHGSDPSVGTGILHAESSRIPVEPGH